MGDPFVFRDVRLSLADRSNVPGFEAMADREDVATIEPPAPKERPALRADILAVSFGFGVVALALLLYVGSFACIAADQLYGWGFVDSLDDDTMEIVAIIYLPLIWLYQAIWGL